MSTGTVASWMWTAKLGGREEEAALQEGLKATGTDHPTVWGEEAALPEGFRHDRDGHATGRLVQHKQLL